MDPKIKSLGRIHDAFQVKSNSTEVKSTSKNPLEEHRLVSKKQVMDQVGGGSAKNIKSEVAEKLNEKLNNGISGKKPPPPKYPAPPPPLGIAGALPNQKPQPPDLSIATDMVKPPPHPATPPPDFPSVIDLGMPPLRPQGAPPDFPWPKQLGNFSHPVVDTKVYAQDLPPTTITSDQKIPYRETPKISKEKLAAGALQFSGDIQDRFFAQVAINEKTLKLIIDCQLTELAPESRIP